MYSAYSQEKNNGDAGKQKCTLSGTVANKTNNETLIGATVFIVETNTSVITNSYGFFSVTLPKGDYTVLITYTGYDNMEEKVPLRANMKRVNISKPGMSTNKLTIATIKKMPPMAGEVNVLKSLLQLPGVTNSQEGASGNDDSPFPTIPTQVRGNIINQSNADDYLLWVILD